MKITKLTRFLLLQLFADGGDGAGTPTGDTGTDAASQSGENALPIRYLDAEQGKPEPAAEAQTEKAEEPDVDAEFDALIKKGGKYHDTYTKKFQKALGGRMKANKEQQEAYDKSQKVIHKLAQAYKLSPDDIDGIDKALDADDNLFADAAMDEGMSVEAYREVSRIRAENELYKQAEAERVQREEAEKTFRQWLSDADAMQEVYPGFDLESELKNPGFVNLLRNGFEVRNAYEAVHHEEILNQAVQTAAKQAKERLSKSIAANSARPDENAGSRNAAATAKRDIWSLSDKELDEIDELSRKQNITLG